MKRKFFAERMLAAMAVWMISISTAQMAHAVPISYTETLTNLGSAGPGLETIEWTHTVPYPIESLLSASLTIETTINDTVGDDDVYVNGYFVGQLYNPWPGTEINEFDITAALDATLTSSDTLIQVTVIDFDGIYNDLVFFDVSQLQMIYEPVPAPMALSLLCIGLVGVGAATKLRKKLN